MEAINQDATTPQCYIFGIIKTKACTQYLLENRVRASTRRFCCSLWCLCWLADLVIRCVKLTCLNVAPVFWLFVVPPVSGAWVWRHFHTLLWGLNVEPALEQRLQQDAYVPCALHLQTSPPLNSVDIPLPRAMSTRDGSQANDHPPSFLPSFPTEKSHLPPLSKATLGRAALKTLLFGGVLGKSAETKWHLHCTQQYYKSY